jgi:hypothetical protein
MLISMPTDTSTILGVFQAILALLVKKPHELFRCGTGADVDQASAVVLKTQGIDVDQAALLWIMLAVARAGAVIGPVLSRNYSASVPL